MLVIGPYSLMQGGIVGRGAYPPSAEPTLNFFKKFRIKKEYFAKFYRIYI